MLLAFALMLFEQSFVAAHALRRCDRPNSRWCNVDVVPPWE